MSALMFRFSQSLARLRQRFNHPYCVRLSIVWVGRRSPWAARPFDDFGFEVRQNRCERGLKRRPLVGAVGEELFEKREHSKQSRQQRRPPRRSCTSAGVMSACKSRPCMSTRIWRFFSLDQLARIEAVRIDAAPSFSALLTLWLSTMQALGLVEAEFFPHLT